MSFLAFGACGFQTVSFRRFSRRR